MVSMRKGRDYIGYWQNLAGSHLTRPASSSFTNLFREKQKMTKESGQEKYKKNLV